MQTLSLYLDQERKNLEKLRNTSGQDANIVKAETTIRTLENQLKQTRGEVSLPFTSNAYAPNPNIPVQPYRFFFIIFYFYYIIICN